MVYRFLFLLFLICSTAAYAYAEKTARGTVFIDENRNGVKDPNETGVENVCVSNGKDVVVTDKEGFWSLTVGDEVNVFVIKPSGFSVAVNENMIPQHFFCQEPELDLPEFIDFPLYPSKENKKFSAVFFGDTQARGFKEVNYIFHDAVEELIGTQAAFGVSLGDNVADDPLLMDEISKGIAHIGIPWYNTFGNHDSDRDAVINNKRDETFERFFGPSSYAYEYGDVAFIDLNNIYFNPKGRYKSHFTKNQLNFVKNYLKHVPKSKLLVLMMHAPILACDNHKKMYKIIQKRPHCFSVSGHLHEQVNVFIDEKSGWKGATPHHHFINATVSGSWWCGAIDELGIPHATMNDGAPNGYSIITFDGNSYSVRFKAARRPENYQMNIYLPNEIEKVALDTTSVLVNVFAGSERSKVEMKIGENDVWIPMDMISTIDPECLRMHKLNPYIEESVKGEVLEDVLGYKMDYPSISHHMWTAKLPKNIKTGTHKVTVRTTDMYNQSWQAHRIFRLTETEN